MALPKLNNDLPQFELTVPSIKKVIQYRPFLVREQKALLIAMEGNDPRNMFKSLLNILQSCVKGVDVYDLATFDIDYIFSRVRAKSVGETADLNIKCNKCKTQNKVSVNIEEIEVRTNPDTKMIIEVTKDISIKMKYPSYADIYKSGKIFEEKPSGTEVIFDLIINCMESVQTETENVLIKDQTKEDIDEFLNSLTNDQFESLAAFANDIPSLKHDIKFNCIDCSEENIYTVEGLQDFFT